MDFVFNCLEEIRYVPLAQFKNCWFHVLKLRFFACKNYIYIYIYLFFLLRGGLDDFLLNSDRTLGKKWSNLRLARIGGGLTTHDLFIYDLSLENYLKVGVFKMEILFRFGIDVTVYTLLEGVTFARTRIVLLSSGLMWIDGSFKQNISFHWWRASRSHSHSDDGGDDHDVVVVVDIEDPLHHLQIYIYISNQFYVFFHGSVLGAWEINSGTWLTCMNFSDVIPIIANLFRTSFLTTRNDMYKRPIQI